MTLSTTALPLLPVPKWIPSSAFAAMTVWPPGEVTVFPLDFTKTTP